MQILDKVPRASRLCSARGYEEGTYKENDHINGMLCKVLVDGQIRDFLGWDVEVISE